MPVPQTQRTDAIQPCPGRIVFPSALLVLILIASQFLWQGCVRQGSTTREPPVSTEIRAEAVLNTVQMVALYTTLDLCLHRLSQV